MRAADRKKAGAFHGGQAYDTVGEAVARGSDYADPQTHTYAQLGPAWPKVPQDVAELFSRIAPKRRRKKP